MSSIPTAARERVPASVATWIDRHGLPPEGRPLVVGCSGGADSTSLLLALAEWGRAPLHVVYVDHGLRAGVDAEAAMVESLASSLGAAFELARVDVARSGNLLAAARRARYDALVAIAIRQGATCIAVGHTASDQAETVVFRAQRGDLEHGLAGMPAHRAISAPQPDGTTKTVTLIRPLLDVTRAEAASFVSERGIRAVKDPSNEKDRFTRVRIRRALETRIVDSGDANSASNLGGPPRLDEQIAQMASMMAAEVSRLDEAAIALGSLDELDAAEVQAAGFDVALRLLRRAGLFCAGRAHARALLSLAASSAGSRSLDLGQGIRAERTYRRIRLGRSSPAEIPGTSPTAAGVQVAGAGRYPFAGRVVELTLAPTESASSRDALDPALVPSIMVLRHIRPGDRLRFSMGRRKLQDVLVDRKVPRARRGGLFVLAAGIDAAGGGDGSEIFWLEGVGAASDVRPRGAGGLALQVLGPGAPAESYSPLSSTRNGPTGGSPSRLT